MCITLNTLAYFILDEPEIIQMIKLAKKSLHIDLLTKAKPSDMLGITTSMEVYLSLYKHFKTEYDTELQEVVLQWIIANFTENFYLQSEYRA